MLENLQKYHIILGSASPRRQELLKGINIAFDVLSMHVDEQHPSNLSGKEIPLYLAEKKANAFQSILTPNTLIITADTIVLLNGKVLEKPSDKNDAHSMLRKLSGKTHEVITGVCILTIERMKTFYSSSRVRFAQLNDSEIEYYIRHYTPYDKAGSYGIQEWIGFIAVEEIQGSYFNVMGLPVQRLYNELKQWV